MFDRIKRLFAHSETPPRHSESIVRITIHDPNFEVSTQYDKDGKISCVVIRDGGWWRKDVTIFMSLAAARKLRDDLDGLKCKAIVGDK